MATQEWTTVEKGAWGSGPWQDEPDKVQWVDEGTGLDCLIVRGPSGALCGYVGVGPDHPWHGKGYSRCLRDCGEDWCSHSPGTLVEVHGGLTFADACAESEDPSHGICHVPEPGRPEHVWWFGFDCAHSGDVTPASNARMSWRASYDEHYRDLGYVERQVARLAQQIAAPIAVG